MGKKVLVDVSKIGALGGKATAEGRTAQERSEAARKAIQARWDAYYAKHPEKRKKPKSKPARKKR